MSGPRRAPLLRLLMGFATLTLVAAGQLLGAAPALAHDVLESTNPADRSTVPVTPGEVSLTFDQPAFAVGSQVLVNGPGGNYADGPVKIVDSVVQQAIQAGAPAGSYTVEWRVTSADGHPVTGQFGFTSQAASAGSPSPTSSGGPSTPAAGSTASSTGGSTVEWVLGLIALVAVWVAIIGFLIRIRRRSRSDPPQTNDRRPGPRT